MKYHAMFATHALLPTGWAKNVLLEWDASGVFTAVTANWAPEPYPPSPAAHGSNTTRTHTHTSAPFNACAPVLPGMPNLHSHAFQRSFAGFTESRCGEHDSFWIWRERMYQIVQQIQPQQLQDIAQWLYVEMLEAGYTSVCEFHYLHHQPKGLAYDPAYTLARVLLDQAQATGLGMTLLPVAYQHGGFGGQAATAGQSRFVMTSDAMLRMLGELQPMCAQAGAKLGLAPHSLRALTLPQLQETVAGMHALDASAPIHIHIAEQQAEVDACLANSGLRPVQWLLRHMPVDARWCLVHATHMTPAESAAAAKSGAVAGLCPSTEANLGDGIFDWPHWQAAQGAYGIGSDSHVCVNAAEDLMLLEYSQRLARQRRNVCTCAPECDTATCLYNDAVAGGAQASGRAIAGLAVGQRADMVVLDRAHPALSGLCDPALMLAGHVFASARSSAIDQVWLGGVQRVAQGRHALHDAAVDAFAKVRKDLFHQD